jgi:hypothetical protein
MFNKPINLIIVGKNFLAGIFVEAMKPFNLVLVVAFPFIVIVFNHFDNASAKFFAIGLCIHRVCLDLQLPGCRSNEVLRIWKIVINVVARLYDVVTFTTKRFSRHVDIVRCSQLKLREINNLESLGVESFVGKGMATMLGNSINMTHDCNRIRWKT